MELYLPKKAEYQGILYDTLTGGFLIEKVRPHLKNNWKDIIQLMSGAYTSRIKNLDQLDEISPVFYGYSMYEVDGVFFNSDEKTIVEERTQVIRLMFRFDIDELLESEDGELKDVEHKIAKLVIDDYLNYCANKPAFLKLNLDGYKKQWPNYEDFIKKVIAKLEHWEFSMVMFVMGYVVFEISEKIKKSHALTNRKPEDEIWITSFWDLRINRITKSMEQR